MVTSTMNQPRILVVGGGSIGQRHVKNLLSVGASVGVVEPDPGRIGQLWALGKLSYNITGPIHTSVELALGFASHHGDYFSGAIVAVPTHLHAECALPLLKLGLPVLIEKPLAHTVESAELLRHYAKQIRVGYTMRFHPAIQAIKEHLPEIGRVIYAHAEVGQHLPQWHPTEDYREWYMAKKEQGGGAILELSHERDYLQWLGAPGRQADAFVDHVDETLQISSDDLADIRGWMGDTRFTCHMDLIDRSYNRRVRILGEKGTLDWDHDRGTVRIMGPGKNRTVEIPTDRNIQFLQEERWFLNWCAGGDSGDLESFDGAFHTLNVVESLVISMGMNPVEVGAGAYYDSSRHPRSRRQ